MTGLALFRFEAGAVIGTGHAMRCLTLADALAREGWQCALAANVTSGALIGRMREVGYQFVEDDRFDRPEQLRARFPDGCDLLVCDSYCIDAAYEAALEGWARSIFVIDDLADRRHVAALLLDQTLGRASSDYEHLVPSGTQLLLGSAYALVRPQFRQRRAEALARRAQPQPVRRLLVSLGGSPQPALLEHIVNELSGPLERRRIKLDVMVGSSAEAVAFPRRDGIRLRPADDICAAFVEADLAVGAAGTSSWERCCLGLPTIMIQLAANQSLIAKRLHQAGAALDLGSANLRPGTLADALEQLAQDSAARVRMAHRAALICDGLGVRRAIGAIAPQKAAGGVPVTLRPVEKCDGELMLEWQRMPETRRFAKDPTVPTRESHFAWLDRRLDDAQAGPFSIILYGSTPAGVLRFDCDTSRESGSYKVSIFVAPALHGRGIASAALEGGVRLIGEGVLNAEVLPGNHASQRLFRKNGFEAVTQTLFRRTIGC